MGAPLSCESLSCHRDEDDDYNMDNVFNMVSDFGHLYSFFRTLPNSFLQHNSKMRGGVGGQRRLEFFRKFIRFGRLTRLVSFMW